MSAKSSSLRLKSKIEIFSKILFVVLDLGIAIIPFSKCQRSMICAGDLLYFFERSIIKLFSKSFSAYHLYSYPEFYFPVAMLPGQPGYAIHVMPVL